MKTDTYTAWVLDDRTSPDKFGDGVVTFQTRHTAREVAHAIKTAPKTLWPKTCVRKVRVTITQIPERPVSTHSEVK